MEANVCQSDAMKASGNQCCQLGSTRSVPAPAAWSAGWREQQVDDVSLHVDSIIPCSRLFLPAA